MSSILICQAPAAKLESSSTTATPIVAVSVDLSTLAGFNWLNSVFHARARGLTYFPGTSGYATAIDSYALVERNGGGFGVTLTAPGNGAANGIISTAGVTAVSWAVSGNVLQFKITPYPKPTLKHFYMLFVDSYAQS